MLSDISIEGLVGVFSAAALIVLLAGTALTRLADRFADITGLGEALTGAILLGAMTSLAGSVTSIVAAMDGRADLAVSNAVGGIAAQTAFLAVADIAYRKVNLEHAATSVENMISGCLLIGMLSVVMLASHTPPFSVLGIHPATIILFAAYIGGLRIVSQARRSPMWKPVETSHTRIDTPDEPPRSGAPLWRFGLAVLALGVVVGVAGGIIAQTAGLLVDRTGLSAGFVGTAFTAVATSLPELVTTVAAVRRGALTLAVAGILGGNSFDVLFIAFSDIAYRSGSVYHAIGPQQFFIAMLGIVMTAILLIGLLHRERHGIGNIGFESAALLGAYLAGLAVLTLV
ncbi:MAG: sodium:calcium antiporter [Alphaproteobacteria bacterium]